LEENSENCADGACRGAGKEVESKVGCWSMRTDCVVTAARKWRKVSAVDARQKRDLKKKLTSKKHKEISK
jgi:hypothetical protein